MAEQKHLDKLSESGFKPFFAEKKDGAIEAVTDTRASFFSEFIEIYLCCFHEIKGHLVLFTIPSHLKNDKNILRILQRHPVWWLAVDEFKEEVDHVDLEFGGKVYSATKFAAKSARRKQRAGMTEETEEVFVLIVSTPVSIAKPLGEELLRILRRKIQESLSDQLYILIMREEIAVKPVKSEEDRKIIEESSKIETTLEDICESAIPEVSQRVIEALQYDAEKQRSLVYFLLSHLYSGQAPIRSIPLSEKSIIEARPVELTHESPVELEGVELVEQGKKLKITVKNTSEKGLENIKITISHIQDIFETYSWSTNVELWFPLESLVFVFPRVDNNGEYIIKVEDVAEKLLVKKISVKELISKEEEKLEEDIY
ncbi:MAG: hypothetical protein ACTSWP_09550 [Candidatus Freyarchaeota archaeon]|nr:hypothetical protein [Candidatus Freyrarchaeum guaymaensis]